jgi:hypothetical protein
MIDDVNVFVSSFVAFYFEKQSAIIIFFCQQEFIQFFNVFSFCEKKTLFLFHEKNIMNTMTFSSREKNMMNTIISSFHVENIETFSLIVENTIISSFQTKVMTISLSREKKSIIVSFIDDKFDADLLNEIALFNFFFTQIKTIKKDNCYIYILFLYTYILLFIHVHFNFYTRTFYFWYTYILSKVIKCSRINYHFIWTNVVSEKIIAFHKSKFHFFFFSLLDLIFFYIIMNLRFSFIDAMYLSLEVLILTVNIHVESQDYVVVKQRIKKNLKID